MRQTGRATSIRFYVSRVDHVLSSNMHIAVEIAGVRCMAYVSDRSAVDVHNAKMAKVVHFSNAFLDIATSQRSHSSAQQFRWNSD